MVWLNEELEYTGQRAMTASGISEVGEIGQCDTCAIRGRANVSEEVENPPMYFKWDKQWRVKEGHLPY
jgi:hypothetical protein